MANSVPYLTEDKRNYGESELTYRGTYRASSTNFFNLNKTYVTSKNGIGQGTKPLPVSVIKSPKEDLLTDRRIDTFLTLDTIMDKVNKSINLPNNELNTYRKILEHDVKYYNRFKIANPNAELQVGYPHVFFVAPMCNILSSNCALHQQFQGVELYEYINRTSPEVLQEISRINKRDTDFSLLLSNYVKSFSLSDEYINTDTYGKTFTGYKISFGKNDIESKTAGTVEVSFNDTRNLDIYKLNRAWVEYISGVYRGMYMPRNEDILQKVLDYTGAIYYILTAEDGETIVFWSKYYGVFPTTMPSTQYTWGEGNAVQRPDLSISYSYSFKKDYDPFSLVEFNTNARAGNINSYLPIYDSNLDTIGDTFVRRPFIEMTSGGSNEYKYKLRFQK